MGQIQKSINSKDTGREIQNSGRSKSLNRILGVSQHFCEILRV